MKQLPAIALSCVLLVTTISCAGADETAVRALVERALAAARAGDTEAVRQVLHDESALSTLLASRTAQSVGEREELRAVLERITIEIAGVRMDGPNAQIVLNLRSGEREIGAILHARRQGEEWRLEDLPSLPAR